MARNWRMRTATHFRSRETARTRSAEYKLACDAALVEVGMGFHCYSSRDEFPSIKQVFRSVLLEKKARFTAVWNVGSIGRYIGLGMDMSGI